MIKNVWYVSITRPRVANVTFLKHLHELNGESVRTRRVPRMNRKRYHDEDDDYDDIDDNSDVDYLKENRRPKKKSRDDTATDSTNHSRRQMRTRTSRVSFEAVW